MKLSTIILTHNSQQTIEFAVKSASFADEVIVVDDNSADATVSIAKKLGAKVIQRRLNKDFSAQRNFGLTHAQGDWVLFLDSDEQVTEALKTEILEAIGKSTFQSYRLKRRDIFFGKELRFGETAAVNLIRLGKRDAGVWLRPVHEIWQIQGAVGQLKNPLRHLAHPTIASFIDKINYYTSVEANSRVQLNQKVSLLSLCLFPVGKFIQNYILRQGFRDQMPGLVMAFGMSLHSLILRIKIYEKRL